MTKNLVLVLILMALLAACAGRQADQVATRTGSPVVHIQPLGGDYRHTSILILPFQVPRDIAPYYGQQMAELYQEVFLGKEVFARILASNQAWGTRAEAVAQGKKAGVDLVLAGRINYLLSGTELGGARADVSLRVVNVKSGNTIWYISQMMDQQVDHPEWRLPGRLMTIFTIPKVRSSSGPAVLPNMLAHIAMNMGEVMAGQHIVTEMGKL